ncbi:hypothetical protein [Streptomyces sp. NPDC054887]
MSVSDEGGKPAPSRSAAGREAAAAEHDGGRAQTGTGIGRTSGRVQEDRGGGRKAKDDKARDDPKKSPGASPGVSAAPSKSREALPRGGHPRPKPPRPGVPAPSHDTPAPTQPPEPPEPPPATEPPPPEPSETEPTPPPPSASPAADTQTAAMGQRRELRREPEASPQVGPV